MFVLYVKMLKCTNRHLDAGMWFQDVKNNRTSSYIMVAKE